MLTLITGGSASGKSKFAEQLAIKYLNSTIKSDSISNNLIYIATMIPFDNECIMRIAKHKEQRASKNFTTIECYTNLASCVVPKDSIILLECLSNLVANEMYDINGSCDNTKESILLGISHLQDSCSNLIIVSNEVFSDGNIYDSSTNLYIKTLASLNNALSIKSDNVIEVVYGIPIFHKNIRKEL